MNGTNFLLLIMGFLLIAPLYYMGLYFLFIHLNEKITNNKIKKNVDIYDKIAALEASINKIDEGVDDVIEKSIEKYGDTIINEARIETQRANAELNLMIAKLEDKKFRMSLSVANVEKNVNEIVKNVVDVYMNTVYYNNKDYAVNDGTYNIPLINNDIRKKDLERIYLNFITVVSNDLLQDLSIIYDITGAKGEEFIITKFLVPYYNSNITYMQKTYKEMMERKAEELKIESEENNYVLEGINDELSDNENDYYSTGQNVGALKNELKRTLTPSEFKSLSVEEKIEKMRNFNYSLLRKY